MTQETSLLAYYGEVASTLGARQATVLAVFTPGANYSNAEVAKKLGWEINRLTPRTNELVKLGLLKAHSKRKCRETGRTVIAWESAVKVIQRLQTPVPTQLFSTKIGFYD